MALLLTGAGEEDGGAPRMQTFAVADEGGNAGGPGRFDGDVERLEDQLLRGAQVVVVASKISSTSAITRASDSAIGSETAIAVAIVSVPGVETKWPAAKLRAIAGAPLAHTPTIRVCGRAYVSQHATPEISAPSPT